MLYGESLSAMKNTVSQPSNQRHEPEYDDAKLTSTSRDKFRRWAKVYDAVAGRVNAKGFIQTAPSSSKYRDTASTSFEPSRPDEILFRRRAAPTRYEETDFYYANESLPSDCRLPSSDLLVAIHAYTADFYRHATRNRGRFDYESMDETALIAMGILMEEMAKESLGETGDLVLVEGETISENEGGKPSLPLSDGGRGLKRAFSSQTSVLGISGNGLEDAVRNKKAKRRKVLHQPLATEMDTENDQG
ncbi:hypothetical protein PHISCL_06432 [Aspergillus sclerotialis]|uniref:Uncharacterized protein n=1 Tax=Aspergillus sclerotialis TaxID=2070753 RepID=A0A3A2ZDK0_9EURO|nr:hypothetical protein PHISCL_06432 [Aspergillus sclerotialis]